VGIEVCMGWLLFVLGIGMGWVWGDLRRPVNYWAGCCLVVGAFSFKILCASLLYVYFYLCFVYYYLDICCHATFVKSARLFWKCCEAKKQVLPDR
jgi:hypothetical protein